MMLPVSILIPVHNCETHIQQCLESAIASSPAEIIVFDDASTDGTSDLIRKYPVGYYRSQERVGAQSARNQLINLSCAEWLQFMDADDYLLPEKLESQIGKGEVSYTNFQVEKYVNRNYKETYQASTNTHGLLLSLLIFEWMPLTGCWLFHRSVFDRVKWDETPGYRYGMHDRKLTLDLLRAGFNPVHVDHPGYLHRCGWSGGQIGAGEHYLNAKKQFLSDLFDWVHSVESQTWRRFEHEKSLEGTC